jgi:TolA-binding protein
MFFLLSSAILIAANAEAPDVAKALEFQYQQKLSNVQNENAKLQSEISKLRQELKERNSVVSSGSQTASSTLTDRKEAARKAYREALKDIEAERWDEAIVAMEAFTRDHPKSDFADHALYWIAQIYIQKGEIELARAELIRLLELYPKGKRAKRARARLVSLPDTKIQSTKAEPHISANSSNQGDYLK